MMTDMRKNVWRKYFLSSVLGGSLAMMGTQTHAASFQQSLQPSGAWSLTKIDGAHGTDGYCALAKRYSGDMVLTFARNPRGELTAAFDFQRPVLSKSAQYTLKMDAGAGYTRSFQVTPVSDKAVIARLGGDEKFMSALAGSGVLNVSLNEQTYSFNIPDMPKGKQEIENCVASLSSAAIPSVAAIEPAAGGTAPSVSAEALLNAAPTNQDIVPAPLAPSVPTGVNVAEIQKLQDENLRLRTALERERRAFEQNMAQLGDNSRTAEMLEKVKLLEAENNRLRERAAGSVSYAAEDGEASLLRQENTGLRAQLSELEQRLRDQQAQPAPGQIQTGEDIARLQTQIAQLQTENANLANALRTTQERDQAVASQSQEGALSTLRAEVERLTAENRSISEALTASRAAAPSGDMAAATALAASRQETLKLREQNAALQARAEQLQAQLQGAGATQVAQSPAEIEALRAQIISLRGENEQMVQGLRAENIALKGEVESLRAQASTLAASPKATVETEALNSLQARIAALQGENATLQQNLAQARQDVANAANMPATETESLRAENGALKQQLQTMQAQMQSLQTQLQTAQNQAREAQETAIQATAIQASAVPPAVDHSRDETIARMQKRIEELQAENTRLAASMNEFKATPAAAGTITLAQLRSVEAQLRGVEADRDRLVRQLEDIRTGKSDGLMSIASANWDLEQATKRYNDAERTIQRLTRELETERITCMRDKKEIEYMLFDPKIATREQIAKLSETEDLLRMAEAKLAVQGGNTVEAERTYMERFAALDEQLNQRMSALEQKQAELDEMNRRLAGLQQDIVSREQELADARNAVSMTQSTLSGLQSDLQYAESAARQARAIAPDTISAQIEDDVQDAAAHVVSKIESAAGTPKSGLNVEVHGAKHTRGTIQVEPLKAAGGPDKQDEQKSSAAQALAMLLEEEASAPVPAAKENGDANAAYIPGTYVPPTAPVVAAAKSVTEAALPQKKTPFAPASLFSNMLAQAGVNLVRGVENVAQASAGTVSYSWETSELYGSAEQREMASSTSFDNYVQQYIKRTEARCQGDFAAVPGKETVLSAIHMTSYEIACVSPDGAGATASLLFYAQDGVFTTIAHESGVAGMDAAMDARDKMAASVGNTKLASR